MRMATGTGPEAGTRRRLPPHERRAALLTSASAAFTGAAYEDVSVADVAARAGVSEPLVFRYFPTKATLHAAVVQGWADDLMHRQDVAVGALPSGAPARDRVRAALEVLLDDAAAGGHWWFDPGSEPATSAAVVATVRDAQVDRLRVLLPPHWVRHDYAIAAYPGFVEAGVRRWAGLGCPPDERAHLIQAALGALEGALGDWGG